eukprot:280507-Rhodomonas_salina.2
MHGQGEHLASTSKPWRLLVKLSIAYTYAHTYCSSVPRMHQLSTAHSTTTAQYHAFHYYSSAPRIPLLQLSTAHSTTTAQYRAFHYYSSVPYRAFPSVTTGRVPGRSGRGGGGRIRRRTLACATSVPGLA